MTNATRTSEFVTDTMALVLRIERRKLGPTVKSIFDSVLNIETFGGMV